MTIILDRWWTHDYAKNWCKMPVHQCSEAEAELEVSSNAPADAAAADHWSLSFDFAPERERQDWSVVYGMDWKHGGNGEGGPETAAHSVCAFVKHIGGSTD